MDTLEEVRLEVTCHAIKIWKVFMCRNIASRRLKGNQTYKHLLKLFLKPAQKRHRWNALSK